jgi:hypothetical protein
LRRLTIDLNATSCGSGWWCEDEQDPNIEQESQSINDEEDLTDEKELDPLKQFQQYEATRQRNEGELKLLSITNYSRSRPLAVTNELHAVSSAYPDRLCSLADDPFSKAVLWNWHRVWIEKIRPNLRPATLELDFSCDVADAETGQFAVQPFLAETRPYMAKCNIRLARHKNEALRRIARSAVERVVCAAESGKLQVPPASQQLLPRKDQASLMSIPTEIRRQILEYTDLVVPDNEIEWSAHRGWYIRRGEPWQDEQCTPCLFHMHPIAEDKSENTNDFIKYTKIDLERACCQEKLGGRRCFCKNRHTVYSSYSKLNCWAPPTPLFLICSVIRHEALQVFFTQNRIVVWPSKSMCWVGILQNSPGRLHISTFLMDVVPKEALRYLRYLEVVFDMPYHPRVNDAVPLDWCSAGSTELVDWQRTIEEIRAHVVSSNLSITVVFPGDMGSYLSDLMPDADFGHSEAELQLRKACLYNALLPLKRLSPLKHLCVDIWGYPGGWEIMKTIMGPSYEPPCDSEYITAELPVPLFARKGRWLSDAQRFV